MINGPSLITPFPSKLPLTESYQAMGILDFLDEHLFYCIFAFLLDHPIQWEVFRPKHVPNNDKY